MVFLRYWRRRRPSILFSDGPTLRKLPVSWAALGSRLLPVLYGLGLAMLVAAMARPQRGLDESRVNTEVVDIVLLVDVSLSMEAIDLSDNQRLMNRLDAAKQVIEKFIASREADRIGMVAFAGEPYTVAPLTLYHPWLLEQMKLRLSTSMFQPEIHQHTAIGDGLASAVNRLRDSQAVSKLVILLTDGSNNFGEMSPINAANAAQALGIKVYTVGAGASGLVQVPIRDRDGNYIRDALGRVRVQQQYSEIDEATLKKIAETTGAKFFRADDFDTLQKVYEEIDQLERTEIEVEEYTRYEERFLPFLLAAIALLAAEKILSFSRIGRLP
jgi:Ca-activated chloride channel family protein